MNLLNEKHAGLQHAVWRQQLEVATPKARFTNLLCSILEVIDHINLYQVKTYSMNQNTFQFVTRGTWKKMNFS